MNSDIAHTGPNPEGRINEVLRQICAATPPQGIEDRIIARLARAQADEANHASRNRFFSTPRFAFGALGAAFACAAIVVGSVHHSHAIQPELPGFLTQPASSGVGSAGAARPANHPIEPPPTGRPRSARHLSQGRAVISPQSQRPAGVAVPKIPSPAQ